MASSSAASSPDRPTDRPQHPLTGRSRARRAPSARDLPAAPAGVSSARTRRRPSRASCRARSSGVDPRATPRGSSSRCRSDAAASVGGPRRARGSPASAERSEAAALAAVERLGYKRCASSRRCCRMNISALLGRMRIASFACARNTTVRHLHGSALRRLSLASTAFFRRLDRVFRSPRGRLDGRARFGRARAPRARPAIWTPRS